MSDVKVKVGDIEFEDVYRIFLRKGEDVVEVGENLVTEGFYTSVLFEAPPSFEDGGLDFLYEAQNERREVSVEVIVDGEVKFKAYQKVWSVLAPEDSHPTLNTLVVSLNGETEWVEG